ncbi:DUF932 domain-containing protein [Chitinophaga silvisoli]|uniref:DUF945 domain-containing protein n=1 Tax=Chitinophaga silvisoli TaxID=2291814 RepID=A0A3E1P3P2_9BACT|nr:DUF932 domain-containing protein [Chitinophaga silvisoli]RFM34740.1 DUF945 domain-containing protein [Chitinophaga silvisoli]
MADNINFNQITGKHAFYSVREKAWHDKGQIVNQYQKSDDVLIDAQLNFDVVKRPIITYDAIGEGEGELIMPDVKVPGFFATVRTDTNKVLGVVGSGYEVIQNIDAFSFFDSIAGAENIFYETAGALGQGERIFITAKLPSHITVAGIDTMENYLFLTTSHDGSGSIVAGFTPVRIVCNNTLNAALRGCPNKTKIRHTANAKDRLKEANRVMGMVNKCIPAMSETFNHWAKISITDQQVKELITLALAPNVETIANIKKGEWEEVSTRFKNQLSDAFSYAFGSDTQLMDTTKGKLYGAYNAVTGYFQNVSRYDSSADQVNAILYGGTAEKKAQKAFDLCEAFAQYGGDALQFN